MGVRIGCLLLIGIINVHGLWASDDGAEPPVDEGSSPWAVDVVVEFSSKYFWRGFDVFPDSWVWHPELEIGHQPSGLWLNLWVAQAVQKRDEYGLGDELDLTLGWDRPLGKGVVAGIGGILYWYPRFDGEDERTRELFARCQFQDLPLSPEVAYFHDFDLGRGGYLQITGDRQLRDFELGFESGFTFKQYTSKSGLSHLALSLAYVREFGGGGWISPFVRGALIADEERNPDDATAWFGVSIGWGK